MAILNINSKQTAALIESIGMSIDILDDTAVEPMWLSPTAVRELAGKSDEVIRTEIAKMAKEIGDNFDKLETLQKIWGELHE